MLKAASWLPSLHELGNCPGLECFAFSGNPSLVLRGVIGVLLSWRMLRQCRLEIGAIHEHIPLRLHLLRVVGIDNMIGSLRGFDFGVRMNGGGVDGVRILIKGSLHLVI